MEDQDKPSSNVAIMKRLKRRLSQTFRNSTVIEDSLSELTESMSIEENGTKEGELYGQGVFPYVCPECNKLKFNHLVETYYSLMDG